MKLSRVEMKQTNTHGIGSATAIHVFGVLNMSIHQVFQFVLDEAMAPFELTHSGHSNGGLSSTLLYSTSLLTAQVASHTLVIRDIQKNMLFQSLVYT